jgi:cadmium resistance protein CadD (predicted permease)
LAYHLNSQSTARIPVAARLKDPIRISRQRIPWQIGLRMKSLVTLGLAVVVFASTNIDDVFVLVTFFADKNFRARDVVIGQYAGVSMLYAISAIAALISLIIPPAYIGLLGVVPIAIGVRKLYNLWCSRKKEEYSSRTDAHGRSLAVAAVTMANGGDNIAVYTALFATRSGFEVPAIGVVFAIMTGLWCLAAHWLVNHRALGAPIRRYAHRVVPFVLIGLGFLILARSGTFHLVEI